jgi:8-hydroxy-5-deazaflavin:NADPH oxidoreductase
MRIGLIGSGNIGSTLARLWVDRGHEVWLSNSRGPETLVDLAGELGPTAHPSTAADAAEHGEIVLVSVPFGRFREIPAAPLAGKVVIDTNNYYPQRDGQWPELDDDSTTSSELLASHLGSARVVKAFNTIYFKQLLEDGTPAGTPGRRALPIAGDDAEAKAAVAALLDELGYDAVDAGPLTEGRRFQPDTPPYGPRMTAAELREALG